MELFFVYDSMGDLLFIETSESNCGPQDAVTVEVHEVDLFAPTRIITL